MNGFKVMTILWAKKSSLVIVCFFMRIIYIYVPSARFAHLWVLFMVSSLFFGAFCVRCLYICSLWSMYRLFVCRFFFFPSFTLFSVLFYFYFCVFAFCVFFHVFPNSGFCSSSLLFITMWSFVTFCFDVCACTRTCLCKKCCRCPSDSSQTKKYDQQTSSHYAWWVVPGEDWRRFYDFYRANYGPKVHRTFSLWKKH